MALFFRGQSVFALALATLLSVTFALRAEDRKDETPCTEDAMLVFDASGSMAGNLNQGIATTKPRIEEVRAALKRVLPSITRFRRVGLIVYGPGPYQQCNVKLTLKPAADAGERIMAEVNALTPAGKTPLTAAVAEACNLGKELHGKAERLTVHVIAFRVKDYSWTGEQSILDAKCLAESNGGLYVTADAEQDLAEALEKTLGCPMLSKLDK